MASPVGKMNVKNSKATNNKSAKDEGSRFWTKLKVFLSCMALSSKTEEGSSSGKNKRDGSKSPKGNNRDEAGSPASSSKSKSGTVRSTISDEIKYQPHLRIFTFHELKLATRNFKRENFLGEGGFGIVFKGWINENGTSPARPGTGIPVAVKTLKKDGNQGEKEWVAEINHLGALHHPNLVRLVGFCTEGEDRLLVYEFMPRGSLEHHLFRRGALPLPWNVRMKIMLGAARGLAFLHEEAPNPMIYRDFKTSNILLDADFNAKLSDFGLVKDAPIDKTHVSTRIMGTQGYAAPEYVMTGRLSSKSDVYSFGVVLLEVLTGRRVMDKRRPPCEQYLVEWARPFIKHGGGFYQLMDPRLQGQFPPRGAHKATRLAAHCLCRDKKARPLMSEVVQVLETVLDPNEIASSSSSSPSPSFKGFHVGSSSRNSPSNLQASPWRFTPPIPSPKSSSGRP